MVQRASTPSGWRVSKAHHSRAGGTPALRSPGEPERTPAWGALAMLGRTAASLYWMSRYVERAENMARLLEVGYRFSLMPSAVEGHRDDWRSTLTSAASEASYFQSYDELRPAEVIQHLLFDETNPSSVKSCIKIARNNGRAVR